MRSDDETPDVPDDADDQHDHEPEPPPPETWAGRRRAEDQAADDEELGAGFTEEFDAIERELDAQLDQESAGERELAGAGPEGSDDEELERPDDEELEEPELEELEELDEAEVEELDEAEVEELAELEEEAADAYEEEEPEGPGGTAEADTLALADREQAEEAAMAGIRARTTEHESKLDTDSGADAGSETEGDGVAVAEAEVEEEPEAAMPADNGKTPRAKPVWARFLAASILIIASMAAATSISLLLYLTDIAKGLVDNDRLASVRDQLEEVDGGDPQTILILGSDKRLGMQGDPGRSDTTILLRVDPNKNAIALLSIPRDLKVNIPRVGVDKFNAAYSAGGPELTLEVVKRLTGLQVNHVVNINFTGFADAVNAIGCVYVDVDRRYYIPPEAGIAEIDVEAGYQRLCGLKALQYVRFRHDDNDLVRSARQQDFLREARQKLPPGTLIRDRRELLDIFTEYTTSDIGDAVTLLELLKTFAGVQTAPVREVHFPAELGDATSGFVTANEEAIGAAVDQFLGVEGTPGARPAGKPDNPPERKSHRGKEKPDKEKPDEPEQDFVGPAMEDSTAIGQQYANQMSKVKTNGGDPMIRFPIYYPTRLAPGSTLNAASRAFPIDGPDKEKYYGYKLAAEVPGSGENGLLTEYYGVSGTDWVDAPILDNPSEVRTIDGKDYLLFYDGDRLRLVGWTIGKAAYWVNNSLLQSLEEGEMLSIATSMREFK